MKIVPEIRKLLILIIKNNYPIITIVTKDIYIVRIPKLSMA